MPTSPRQFTDLQKLTACTITYEQILSSVDAILMNLGKDREDRIKAYYEELLRAFLDSGLRHRMAAEFDPSLLARGVKDSDITASKITKDLADMLKSVLVEKDPQFANHSTEHGTSPEERRDIIISTINNLGTDRTELDSIFHTGRTQSIGYLNAALNELVVNFKHRPDFRFNPDSKNENHTKTSALYFQYEARKAKYEENEQRGGRWRFFHIIPRWRERRFFKKCEEYLNNVGFDKEKHGDVLRERYASQMPEYISYQIDIAKDVCRTEIIDKQEAERMKNTVQLSVAQNKYKNAIELNKNPGTSFATKVAHLIEKYDIPIGGYDGLSLVHENYEKMAATFDTMRDFSKIETETKMRFGSLYTMFMGAALRKNNGVCNPAEVLKDTQEFAERELKHYTVIYEHPDAKSYADRNLFAYHSATFLQNRAVRAFKSYIKNFKKDGSELSPEQEEEIKKQVGDYVTEAREKNERELASQNPVIEEQNLGNDGVAKGEVSEIDSIRQPIKNIVIDDNAKVDFSPVHEEKKTTIELSSKK